MLSALNVIDLHGGCMQPLTKNDEWNDQLRAANIHPETGLATDFLNHFNEVIMLLDMAADMPEMFEDVREWAPLSYQAHFTQSGFPHKKLALEAYAAAPKSVLDHFHATTATFEAMVLAVRDHAQTLSGEEFTGFVRDALPDLHRQVSKLNAVILGNASAEEEVAEESTDDVQAEIDALFD